MFSVMIVEDEMLVRLGLKTSIPWESFGMRVAADFPDGGSAWEYCQREPVDLLITDLRMPVMDGMELITRVRERSQDTVIVIISCLEEFSLVRKAISLRVSDYIPKLGMTEDDIRAVLSRARDELAARRGAAERSPLGEAGRDAVKERALEDCLAGRPGAEDLLTRCASELGLAVRTDAFILCIMRPDTAPEPGGAAPAADAAVPAAAAAEVVAGIARAHGGGEVFARAAEHVILLNAGSARGAADARAFMQAARSAVMTYLNRPVSLGASVPGGMGGLRRMYAQADAALDAAFFNGPGAYAVGDAVDRAAAAERLAALLKEASGLLADEAGHFKRAYEARVDALAGSLPGSRTGAAEEACRLVQWIAGELPLPGDLSADALLSTHDALRGCSSLDALARCVRGFFGEYRRLLQESGARSPEIRRAVEYVRLNYRVPFTLEDAAAYAGLSPNYLSTLFKREMGIGLAEYANERRVEKASKLLLESCLRAYEVGEKVGFSDGAYFSKVFKRVTGASPNDFRRRWMREWTGETDDAHGNA